MQVDRDLFPYVVHSEDRLVQVLEKMSRNGAQMVFCISEHGRLHGVFTDGDFRRWIVRQSEVNLDHPVSRAANTNFTWLPADSSTERIQATFSRRISAIPLLDDRGHLVAIAWDRPHGLRIENRELGDDAPPFVVAEIGNNHNGDVELARRLVDLAADAGVDCVKFQMRSMEELYIDGAAAARQGDDLGHEYTLDLLSRFQLTDDELFQVFDHCRTRGVLPLCTPWDLASLGKLEAYGMPAHKIASADLTNHELLSAAAATGKPLLVSTGMSEEREIVEAIDLLQAVGAPFLLLHCNSTYPAPAKDVNLRYLDRLRELSGRPVGYSGHERGIHVAVAAVARGARVVEKHFTVDRSMEGNDHKVSLLPNELAELVVAVHNVDSALGSDVERDLTQGERLNREILGKSLVAAADIPEGVMITDDMVAVRGPGRGLSPNRRRELVGRVAKRALTVGDFFYVSDLDVAARKPRPYRFARDWGLPVRYHDYRQLISETNPDLLEFHLSYRDLDVDAFDAVQDSLPYDLVVHSPELFAGDHVMDLTSDDPDYRERSMAELQRVVDLTLKLAERFERAERPRIVVNCGGFSLDAPWHEPRRRSGYERIAGALDQIDHRDVELLPQTMPPFPWHFGGQRFHNLFVAPGEIVAFCEATGRRICLDISHTALAARHLGGSLTEYTRALAPHVAHLHVADAKGTDGEGLQVGDGELDFAALADALADSDASFIPEIWQGHKNGGEGFWLALDRLEGRL